MPSPLLAADVVDEDGNSLRGTVGVPGEVVYRSPVVTPGYYRDEEATREAFRGGWFHSGDVCTYDEDGLRIMVDRSKDIVKSGGENVSSLRVEAVLHQHPDVQKSRGRRAAARALGRGGHRVRDRRRPGRAPTPPSSSRAAASGSPASRPRSASCSSTSCP